MNPRVALGAGLVILALVWLGPLPAMAEGSFTAHMLMHLGVLAVAAPLLGYALPRIWPALGSGGWPAAALIASALELAIVWAWHAPALHAFARRSALGLGLEQGSFLTAGLLLWSAALSPGSDRAASGAGVIALLLTSMHMTLLGALVALAQRPFYLCEAPAPWPFASLPPLADQQLGGALMLVVTSAVYLAAGLARLKPMLDGAGPAPLRGPGGRS